MLEWLNDLTPTQASFVGSVIGPAIGLIALLLGALFNGYLNRRRDERLRRQNMAGIAAALYGELDSIRESLLRNSKMAENPKGGMLIGPDLEHSVTVWKKLVSEVQLFDADTVRVLVETYGVFPHHTENLLLAGAKIEKLQNDRRYVELEATDTNLKLYVELNESVASQTIKALDHLRPYMRETRSTSREFST